MAIPVYVINQNELSEGMENLIREIVRDELEKQKNDFSKKAMEYVRKVD